jgi:hypothetical protein
MDQDQRVAYAGNFVPQVPISNIYMSGLCHRYLLVKICRAGHQIVPLASLLNPSSLPAASILLAADTQDDLAGIMSDQAALECIECRRAGNPQR